MLRLVIPHFLARCPVCRERHEEILRIQKEVGHWDPEISVIEGQQAPELWSRLAERPYAEQLREVEEDEELHAWGLCQLLLQKSREAIFSDPRKRWSWRTWRCGSSGIWARPTTRTGCWICAPGALPISATRAGFSES